MTPSVLLRFVDVAATRLDRGVVGPSLDARLDLHRRPQIGGLWGPALIFVLTFMALAGVAPARPTLDARLDLHRFILLRASRDPYVP
jgi:hypothetical protein